jgi:AcrR family transcriptional regulator
MGGTATAVSGKRMSAPARREQLLDVTAAIVAEQGFPAVSIQAVARRAEVSRPIVYEHFGDLSGLLESLIKRETDAALVQVAETQLRDLTEGNPTELMLESLSSYLSAVEQHPDTWRLVLMPAEGAPESLRKSISRGRAAVLGKLTYSVRQGLRPGEKPPDSDLTARMLSALADEYARLVLVDSTRFSPERLLSHARWLVAQLVS